MSRRKPGRRSIEPIAWCPLCAKRLAGDGPRHQCAPPAGRPDTRQATTTTTGVRVT